MNKNTIISIVIGLIVSGWMMFLSIDNQESVPKEVYRVYLEGKSIGLIESKDQLETFIDKQQQQLKEKYHVDKIYIPKNLDIEKEVTFSEEVSTVKEIYHKINDITPFTINGYKITIKGTEEKTEDGETTTPTETIYVLDKDIFTTAVDKTIRSFIPSDDYDSFLNETQKEIVDTGKWIEDIYIENDITIKEANIPVDEMIYTKEEDLSRYLLFGTLEEQQTYTVKGGDTIEDVAFANKISPEEFLIANPNFKNANSLLYEGQEVTLGILKPIFKTVEEDHTVEIEEKKYTTEIRYNNDLLIGTTNVIQQGQNGSTKVTRKIKSVNGEITSVVTASTEDLVQMVPEIIERGGKSTVLGDVGFWGWPTITPYIITSPYGYRWGVLHDAIDIAGCGYGSPIFSTNNGVVAISSYNDYNGHYIIINHNNGYYTYYGHMSRRIAKVGDNVEMGTVIGEMGQTGFATGTHLHYGIWRGFPYYSGSQSLNPLSFY